MSRGRKTKFVSIIWGYPPIMHNTVLEENYHLHTLEVAKSAGYEPWAIVKGSKEMMEKDPNFDKAIGVIDYKNIFQFIFRLLGLSFQNSIFYVNSYEPLSFVVPFLSRRTIFMAHTQPKRKTKAKQIIQNFVYKFFTRIRLNNETEKEYLISQGVNASKLAVIPLPVSQNIFRLEENQPVRKDVVYFGSVTLTKNLSTILKALKEVKVSKSDIKLNIIGEIVDDGFVAQVRDLGLENDVIMHGRLAQNEKLTTLLNSMLIFVNSSKNEGQCVAVYDAALCGCVLCLPKIMSFEGVFRDLALFHDVYDHKQLAKNIIFYLDNPDIIRKHRTNCIEMIKKGYSKEVIEEKLKKMIANV